MAISSPSWICCQLGAREHYAIPLAMHQTDQLTCLITDAWVTPGSILDRLPSEVFASLKGRFHSGLADAQIQSFKGALLQFEFTQKLKKTSGWECIIARNNWFQQQAVRHLKAIAPRLNSSTVLFSYSYTALNLFRFAKQQGWQTVLGQIDPGPLEEKLVAEEQTKHPGLEPRWQPVPPNYWSTWQEECSLADRIVVNSNWSKHLLEQTAIDPDKICVVPLVYEPPEDAKSFTRLYPSAFTHERPLRVLFLGNVTLRKGVAALLDAIGLLQGEPIEFWVIGTQQITIPPQFQKHPQIRWVGQVPRSKAQFYYQQADVFLFPTLSDGFGLTQLEAQAWKLPIIASKYCGEVISDSVNGRILPQVSGKEIAKILLGFLAHPHQVKALSQSSINLSSYSLKALNRSFQQVISAPHFLSTFRSSIRI